MHHLTRVLAPVPSRAHPLAGLWRADFTAAAGDAPGGGGAAAHHGADDPPDHGVQVLAVTYDFTGAAAQLVAVKVGM